MKVKSYRVVLVMVLLMVALMSTGCFGTIVKVAVDTAEMGVIKSDGVTIDELVGAGRYSDSALHASIHTFPLDAYTTDWNDPSLLTGDKQPIGLVLQITYKRTSDPALIKELWPTYSHLFTNDDALREMVLSKVPEAAKTVTVSQTLDEMLGIRDGEVDMSVGRDKLKTGIEEILAPRLLKFGCVLVEVNITDIAPSEGYLALLEEKAQTQIQLELSTARTGQLAEQLKQEVAQTNIDVEIASRENKVAQEQAKVYETSEAMFRLRELELTAQAIGDNDKIFFVPEGSNITMLLTGDNSSQGNTSFLPLPQE